MWDVTHDKPPASPLLRMQNVVQSPVPTAASIGAAGSGGGAVAAAAGSSSARGSPNNPLFNAEVKDARFFYLDKLILLASGSTLHLYAYSLGQKTPSNDGASRAAELRHRYKLQHKWHSPSAQSLTCLAAANSFLSPIVLTAGSDKSIHAIDLGAPGGASIVLTLNEAHERPVHLLRLSEGSAYSEAPQAAHDLILSASVDGHVKLWDLRSASCVRKFSAHTNRLHPLGASLSPCLRYVVAGSEDRSAYLYDAKSGSLIERIKQPPTMDVVSDAAFSPMHPQLALGGLDGSVRFYSDGGE